MDSSGNHTLCIYSDESGVFDYRNERYFVFGGLILFNDQIEDLSRRHASIESKLKEIAAYADLPELKASYLSSRDRRKIFSLLKDYQKFGAVIDLGSINRNIFSDKKSKQRYMDYAYKIAVKRAFEDLIRRGMLSSGERLRINFFVDEHSTATNGLYELEQGLLQEFKEGTFNYNFQKYFPPIFPNLDKLSLRYVDSKANRLIRASDIIANRIYFELKSGKIENLYDENFRITFLPYNTAPMKQKL